MRINDIMAEDYITKLNSRLSALTEGKDSPDSLTRDIGGFNRNNQPFISGYFQTIFHLPERIFDDCELAVNWLHSSCEGFTPPASTLNTVDIIGIGQTGASFPTSTTITREFTLTFREYQNLPVLNILRLWNGVFDPHVGVSPLKGSEMIPSSYKGTCYVAQMKPTLGAGGGIASAFEKEDFEEIFSFDGVVPTNVPFDSITNDLATNDVVQYSITFKFDGFPITIAEGGDTLVSKVGSLLGDRDYMKTFENRLTNLTG